MLVSPYSKVASDFCVGIATLGDIRNNVEFFFVGELSINERMLIQSCFFPFQNTFTPAQGSLTCLLITKVYRLLWMFVSRSFAHWNIL